MHTESQSKLTIHKDYYSEAIGKERIPRQYRKFTKEKNHNINMWTKFKEIPTDSSYKPVHAKIMGNYDKLKSGYIRTFDLQWKFKDINVIDPNYSYGNQRQEM